MITNHRESFSTRRKFLEGLALLTVGLFLSGCNDQPTSNQSTVQPESNGQPRQVNQPPIITDNRDNRSETELIKIGELEKNYRQQIIEINKNPEKFGIPKEDFDRFRDMVNNTNPAISLTYYKNPFIEKVRKKQLNEAVILMIAALNVEHSKRYNILLLPSCNTYALDLLRALLGNQYIGDMYDKNFKPVSIGINDIKRGISKDSYRYMNSDMIDNWMRNHGRRFGWEKIPTGQSPYLIPTNSIGVFCTSWNKLMSEKKRDPQYLGHMGIIFHPDPNRQTIIARTQASRHIPFEIVGENHLVFKGIIQGDYNLYYHIYPFGNQ